MIEIIFNPIVTFLIIFGIIFILFLFAGILGPKRSKAKYKLQNYSGGKHQESYNFFHVAFFFTVLHVGVLLVATAPLGQSATLGFLLIGIMGLIAFALFFGGRNND